MRNGMNQFIIQSHCNHHRATADPRNNIGNADDGIIEEAAGGAQNDPEQTTENISALNAEAVSPFSAKLSWKRVYCVGYELLKIDGETYEKVTDIPFGTENITEIL